MTETILVVIALLAFLSIAARRALTGGNSSGPVEGPRDLTEEAEKDVKPEETIQP